MKIDVPSGHQVGMRVPKGGSSCAKCKYVSDDEQRCSQENFVKWNGGPKLPEPADEYCCDFFTIAKRERRSIGDQLKHQKESK
jgi:hypothetical protein